MISCIHQEKCKKPLLDGKRKSLLSIDTIIYLNDQFSDLCAIEMVIIW